MIKLGAHVYSLSDPQVLLVIGGVLLALLMFLVMLLGWRASIRAARLSAPLAQQVMRLDTQMRHLSDGQHQLAGGLTHVSEALAASQSHMLQLMEKRLAEVSGQMTDTLHGSARRTAQSLGDLQQRLASIDKAQENITRLSGDVLSLQDILSNKQTRGAFGEIQLHDIVTKALPTDSYTLQATLSNGRRADCLIHLPNPPGPIAIDSKFPLEAYEALRAAKSERALQDAARNFRTAVRKHLRDIAERYILDGETADGALMFLPSEAVYAELHANFAEVVREGFDLRVWIVSPTTCMATLNTMRAILKDARMREQAGAIRTELRKLLSDIERLGSRVENLDRHFNQAAKDLGEIKISAEKSGRRAKRLDNFDFEELENTREPAIPQVAVPSPEKVG